MFQKHPQRQKLPAISKPINSSYLWELKSFKDLICPTESTLLYYHISLMSTGITCVYQGLVESRAIYISDLESATDARLLRGLNIASIVTAEREVKLVYPCAHIQDYLCVLAQDKETYDISQHFDEVFQFIERVREKGNVLVHCILGISRSATLVLAYLIRKYGFSLNEAMALVRRKRPIINPNPAFMRMLHEYSKKYCSSRKDTSTGGGMLGLRQLRMNGSIRKSISLVPECSSQLLVDNEEEREVGVVPEELSVVLRARNEVEEKLQAMQSYYRSRCNRWGKKRQDSIDKKYGSSNGNFLSKKGVSI